MNKDPIYYKERTTNKDSIYWYPVLGLPLCFEVVANGQARSQEQTYQILGLWLTDRPAVDPVTQGLYANEPGFLTITTRPPGACYSDLLNGDAPEEWVLELAPNRFRNLNATSSVFFTGPGVVSYRLASLHLGELVALVRELPAEILYEDFGKHAAKHFNEIYELTKPEPEPPKYKIIWNLIVDLVKIFARAGTK